MAKRLKGRSEWVLNENARLSPETRHLLTKWLSTLYNFSFHKGFELRPSGQALVVAKSGYTERAERRASLDRLS
jgi:hypothetical protein